MLWRRSAQTSAPSLTPLVPEGEAVRLSALRASWARDRGVARQRIALRWLAWFGRHYGLPTLGVMVALVIAWRGVLSSPTEISAATTASPVPSSHAPIPSSTVQDEPPLQLRFDPVWPVPSHTSPHPVSPAIPAPSNPDAATSSTPHLKPENWLHSKEP